jgi:hypothetical protein
VSLTPVANRKILNQKGFNYFIWTPLWYWGQSLPPVSLILVVLLDLRISPQIFEKIEIIEMGLGGR